MAYNACLARHGPKANGVGASRRAAARPRRTDRVRYGQSATPRAASAEHALLRPQAPSASMGACTWSFTSGERRLKPASAAPEPAEKRRRRAHRPRAVGDQRGGRASRPAPEARQRGIGNPGSSSFAPGNRDPLLKRSGDTDPQVLHIRSRGALAVIAVTLRVHTPRSRERAAAYWWRRLPIYVGPMRS